MYCIKCGREVEGQPKFCPYCGQKLEHVSRRRPEQPSSVSPTPATPVGATSRQERGRLPSWLVALGVALLALAFVCTATVGGIYVWLGLHRRHQAAKITPDETGAFVSISPTLLQLPELRNAESMREGGAVFGTLPGVAEAAEDIQDNLPSDFDLDMQEDVLPWIGREVSMAIVPQGDALPSLLVTAATRNRDASDAFLEEIRSEMEDQGVDFDEDTYRDIRITEIDSPGAGLAYATFNQMVVLASDGEALRESIDAAKEGRSSTLYRRKPFKEALSDLPANRLGYMYVDWTELMGPMLDELEGMDDVPVERLEALEETIFAFSLRKDGLRFDYKTRLDQGKLSRAERDWLQQPSSPRKMMDAAPEESLLYVSGQNLPLLLQLFEEAGVDEMFEEIEHETGVEMEDDLLAHMDGVYAWGVVSDRDGFLGDETMPLGLLLFAEVDDREVVEESMEDLLDPLIEGGVDLDEDEIDGVPVWLLEDDFTGISIGYGFLDDVLFIGTSRRTVRMAAESRNSPLADNPTFRTALKALPSNLRGYSYIDVEEGLDMIYRAMGDVDKEQFNEEIRPYVASIKAVTVGTRPMDSSGVLEGALFICTE